MKILATTFTITAEVDVRKKAPIKMPVCFTSVLRYQLQDMEKTIHVKILITPW